jgi:hypothetical protein
VKIAGEIATAQAGEIETVDTYHGPHSNNADLSLMDN